MTEYIFKPARSLTPEEIADLIAKGEITPVERIRDGLLRESKTWID